MPLGDLAGILSKVNQTQNKPQKQNPFTKPIQATPKNQKLGVVLITMETHWVPVKRRPDDRRQDRYQHNNHNDREEKRPKLLVVNTFGQAPIYTRGANPQISAPPEKKGQAVLLVDPTRTFVVAFIQKRKIREDDPTEDWVLDVLISDQIVRGIRNPSEIWDITWKIINDVFAIVKHMNLPDFNYKDFSILYTTKKSS